MLLRLARQGNYVAVSPSIHQRARLVLSSYAQIFIKPTIFKIVSGTYSCFLTGWQPQNTYH